jgi:hypothetical protein
MACFGLSGRASAGLVSFTKSCGYAEPLAY